MHNMHNSTPLSDCIKLYSWSLTALSEQGIDNYKYDDGP